MATKVHEELLQEELPIDADVSTSSFSALVPVATGPVQKYNLDDIAPQPTILSAETVMQAGAFDIVGASRQFHPKFGETAVFAIRFVGVDENVTPSIVFMSIRQRGDRRDKIVSFFEQNENICIGPMMIEKKQTGSGQRFYDLVSV